MVDRRAVVTLADVLELRDSGLTGSETWSLLCQATQALQDLFLSSKCFYFKAYHPRCVVSNYTIVRTVNEHINYGMVLQMYLTIHKYSIATNVIYVNIYMFRPRWGHHQFV
jgi:hypothetical protein